MLQARARGALPQLQVRVRERLRRSTPLLLRCAEG